MDSLNISIQNKLIDAALDYRLTPDELLYLLRLLRDDRLKEIGNTPISELGKSLIRQHQYDSETRDVPFGTIVNASAAEDFKAKHEDLLSEKPNPRRLKYSEPKEFKEYPPEKDCPYHVKPAETNTETSYPPYLDRAKPEKV